MAQNRWRNVSIAFESARAAAKPMATPFSTAADPVVITATSHGYADDDVIILTDVTGATGQLDNAVVIADNTATSTFECKGLDGTLFPVATGGNAKKLTMGLSLTGVLSISGTGGEPEKDDDTEIHHVKRVEVPVLSTAESFTFDVKWDPGNATQRALRGVSSVLGRKAVVVTFNDTGDKFLFEAYVTAPLVPLGEFPKRVRSTITLDLTGPLIAVAA